MAASGMKKVFVTELDSVTSDDKEGVGTIRWEGNKVYKYVLYTGGTAGHDLVAGDVCYYVDDTGYGAHTVTADVSDASGKEIGAGVVVGTVDDSDFDSSGGPYLWLQIKGFATVSINPGTGGDGDALTCVGAADKGLTNAVDTTASNSLYIVAVAVDDTAKQICCDFPF